MNPPSAYEFAFESDLFENKIPQYTCYPSL